jgi:hypothetical protein
MVYLPDKEDNILHQQRPDFFSSFELYREIMYIMFRTAVVPFIFFYLGDFYEKKNCGGRIYNHGGYSGVFWFMTRSGPEK